MEKEFKKEWLDVEILDGLQTELYAFTCRKKRAPSVKEIRQILERRSQENLKSLWDEIFAAFKPNNCYLAAADGQTGDQIQQETASLSGFVHFVSSNPPTEDDSWHVKLAIPTKVTGDTRLRLQVLDSKEQPIKSGTLVFCGVDIDIGDQGYAYISGKTFMEHIGISLIALKKTDGTIISGVPVRAYEAGV